MDEETKLILQAIHRTLEQLAENLDRIVDALERLQDIQAAE